ncbi:MAG: hypothetical protein M3298_02000 [Thermoproteota archaeon]|nr:hypothetical protein [Thermoproteota archaeon]
MIGLNRRKKDTARSILAPTIFLLSIMMIASTIATPAADTTATTMSQPVTVTTDNQSVNVVISWVPMQIEPGQDTEFTLDFQDPSSGEPISHVNYNLEITDQNGETVESMTDLHTHSGSDQQTVTFDNPGSFNLVTTIIGTGIDPPFDTTQSGTAQTVIPVGQQLASASGGNTTVGTTDTETAPAVDGDGTTSGSACAALQTGGGGQNTTMSTNATTAAGGNQSTSLSSPRQLIEQACIAAQNNDTQGVLMNLNLALNALGSGNMTTATTEGGITAGDEEVEEGGRVIEEEVEED